MTKAEQLELRGEWRKRVAAFKASGLSGAAWCASQGLKPHLLYYWQQQLAAEDGPAETPSQWLPVIVADHQRQEPVGDVLIRGGSIYVEVQPGFNQALLADVIRVLTASAK